MLASEFSLRRTAPVAGSLLLLAALGLWAQPPAEQPRPSRPDVRPAEPARQPISVNADFFRNLRARCIGPASMSGRVTDIAVDPQRPATIYAATATGGLWKSTNNGATWNCVFFKETSVSVGDVEVAAADPKIVWVGTGEENARNSVSWGDGVYKSTDAGQTWKHMGLEDTHHIGAMVIHPKNPDVVYVAALGHFWGPNEERGIYKTQDGGQTWNKCCFLSEDCGFVDLVMDPQNPETLWAAAYAVRRDGFSGGDPAVQFSDQAGIYKTTDGGANWRKLTQGLPKVKAGRIGLCVWQKDPKVLYAIHQTEKTNIRVVAGQPASQQPGDVDTGGVFRSDDGGETWLKLNDLCPRPFYFSKIRIDPTDDQRIFVLGIQLFRSDNGGKTFSGGAAPRVHSDHHAMWINPQNPEHILNGCDGGLYVTYDRGQTWEHMVQIPASQFYGVAVDMRRPYWVYGGLQDNGSWGAPSQSRNPAGIANYDWVRIGGGDGFQCAVDPTDWTCVYGESQYGNLYRVNMATGERKTIRPRHPDNRAMRFNWNSPICLSPHNPRTIYYGSNYLFRSFDRGDNWQVISDELVAGNRGSLTTIAESPARPGVIWTGSDDGKLALTKDGGATWTDLTDNLPTRKDRTISRVEASRAGPGVCYVAVDRHRNDDYRPYLFKTADYGKTWKALHESLPANGSVHVVREDPKNRDLLFCGTEFGLFVSVNGGELWHRVAAGLPTTPVHDLVIHPRDGELVIGTHGRGVWIMDIAPLQQLKAEVLSAKGHLFDVRPAVDYKRPPAPGATGFRNYFAPNPPAGATIWYHLADTVPGGVKLTVHDVLGTQLAQLDGLGTPGLHAVNWNLRRSGGQPTARTEERNEGEVPLAEREIRERRTPPAPGQPTPGGTEPGRADPAQPPRGTQPEATRPTPRGTAPAAARPGQQPGGQRGAGGRGGPFAPAVPPGDYIVKWTIGDKTLQKVIRVLPDEAAGTGPQFVAQPDGEE